MSNVTQNFFHAAKPQYPDSRIYLDMDGVIGDFMTHAHAHGKLKADDTPKWDELDYDWWSTMPAYDGAKVFYDVLKKLAPVQFLTAPVPSTDCFAGKADWVQAFVPERGKFILSDLIICHASVKQRLAGPDAILIDDRIKNVEEWRAAGGIAIHHQGDFAATLAAVNDALSKMNQPKTSNKNDGHRPAI